MDRGKLEQLYSFESVASAFSANGRLVTDILWDRDCDIDHDLQSEDDEMRSMAERYFHSGLTAEYAKKNIALIGKSLQIAATAAGLGKLKAVVHFGFGRIDWHAANSPFTLGDAIRLLNESKVNLCDGGSEFYVQGYSYFQLGAIRYECPPGLSFPFKGWRLAEAIHTLVSHESRMLTRAAVRPEAWLVGRELSDGEILPDLLSATLTQWSYLGSFVELSFDTVLGAVFVVSPEVARDWQVGQVLALGLPVSGVTVVALGSRAKPWSRGGVRFGRRGVPMAASGFVAGVASDAGAQRDGGQQMGECDSSDPSPRGLLGFVRSATDRA